MNEVKHGHLYGEPVPLTDGRVEVSILDYVEWICACGKECRCYEYSNLVMHYHCACERRYEIDWKHGIEPRVSKLTDAQVSFDLILFAF